MLFAATPDLTGSGGVASIPGAPPRLDRPLVACPFAPRCDSTFETCRERAPARSCRSARSTSPPATSPRTVPAMSAGAPLLAVRDLVVHYPLARGLVGHARAPRGARWCAPSTASRSRSPPASSSRSSASRAAARRRPRRRSCACSCRARARSRSTGATSPRSRSAQLRPVRREAQIVFQDPYESLDPRYRVRDTVAEPLVIHRIGTRAERTRARARGARARRALAGRAVPRPLPARALGRPAAARRDRGGARARAEAARGRRARLDARRVRARRHPRPARRAAARRPRHPDDHARPLDRHAVRRPDHGHVPRPHRRGGPGAHRRRQPAAPVHQGADLGRAAARSRTTATRPQILQGETPNPVDIPAGCRFHPRCPIGDDACRAVDPQLEPANGHRAACIKL